MTRAVVIGSGFGGLAAAIRLRAAGHRVSLVEAGPRLGGRAGQIRDAGYTFDTGPTIITAPSLLEDLWRVVGRDLRADVDLVPLRPYYQVRFRDGTSFEYGPDIEAEVARLSPGDLPGYRRFMADTEQVYRRAFEQLGRRPFHTWQQFARVATEADLLDDGQDRGVPSVGGTTARLDAVRTRPRRVRGVGDAAG